MICWWALSRLRFCLVCYDLLVILLLQLGMLILLVMAGNYFDRGWIYALGLLTAAAYF